MSSLQINAFYDEPTYTLSYVVWNIDTRDAVIIDPVLNYDPLASRTSTHSVDELIAFAQNNRLRVHWILETHAHADHLTGAQLLRSTLEARMAIGEKITIVQETFKKVFDLPDSFDTSGGQFDKLIKDGERLSAGAFEVEAIATPGHTPACMTYKIDDAIFTGDALFMHDYGTGRCDFPMGSADDLYTSVHERLYALPDETRVFVGHDYQPNDREMRYETKIGDSKRQNPQLRAETTREEFHAFRTQRDAKLSPPRLIFQSVQVNIDAGRLPSEHNNGIRYLQLPLNMKTPTDDHGRARIK